MCDVACILVNFNSGHVCVSAVQSLLAQKFEGRTGGAGELRIIVVDNASPVDQHPFLDPLGALGVDVVYHDQNLGYGGGMNLGFSRVDHADFVLLANPDILVLEGALAALVRLLSRDWTIGVAGPRNYLDCGRLINHPCTELTTLRTHAYESLGGMFSALSRRLLRHRTLRAVDLWSASGPVDVRMVSGFALFMPFELARQLGPFDGAFPFYFEDADLCWRVRDAGRRVVFEPRSEMVHFYDQSAKSVRAEVHEKYAISRSRYFRKHYGEIGLRLYRWLNRVAVASAAGPALEPLSGIEDLGVLNEPPTIEFARNEREFAAQVSLSPAFHYSGGIIGTGRSLTIGAAAWDALEATPWYVRVLDREDLSTLRAVTFRKARPSLGPVSFADYERMRVADKGRP